MHYVESRAKVDEFYGKLRPLYSALDAWIYAEILADHVEGIPVKPEHQPVIEALLPVVAPTEKGANE